MKDTQAYPLPLPRSLKQAVERAATYFTDRKARADFKAFDKIMKRKGGKKPSKGDEMPS